MLGCMLALAKNNVSRDSNISRDSSISSDSDISSDSNISCADNNFRGTDRTRDSR
jgi:hypothetical protein